MKTRTVRARKKHRCNACGDMIRPGQPYKLIEAREPVYMDDEPYPQVDIIYYSRVRLCPECCSAEGFGFD